MVSALVAAAAMPTGLSCVAHSGGLGPLVLLPAMTVPDATRRRARV
ncbi:hypothetical protein [Nocardia sp. BMG51109]|nr:hypothetical protein [Nocardia sp. BMG51109]